MDERAFNKPGQQKEGFQVVIDTSELKAIEKQLANLGDLGRTAITRTINETLARGRTIVSRDIREKYSISNKDVKSHLKVKKASKGQLKGELDASSPMIPLVEFLSGKQGVGYARLKKGTAKSFGQIKYEGGVQVEILQGQRNIIPDAFEMLLPSGHVGVFKHMPGRSSAGHQKIKQLFSIGTGIMMGGQRASPQISEDMADYFRGRLGHNIEFLMTQAAEKSAAAKSPQ